MTTKLKIDLADGVLEVEGSEAFVKAIYNDFKAHFIGEEAVTEDLVRPKRRRQSSRKSSAKAKASEPSAPAVQIEIQREPDKSPLKTQEFPIHKIEAVLKPETTVAAEPEPKPKPKEPARKSYTFLSDLKLTAANDHPSLVEFMDAKFPITNEERNLVFSHYLENIANLKTIKADHIYTCYRAAKIRAPLDLEASLQSTGKRRWIKITKAGKLTVTPAGKKYVEEQLPKKIKS